MMCPPCVVGRLFLCGLAIGQPAHAQITAIENAERRVEQPASTQPTSEFSAPIIITATAPGATWNLADVPIQPSPSAELLPGPPSSENSGHDQRHASLGSQIGT